MLPLRVREEGNTTSTARRKLPFPISVATPRDATRGVVRFT